MTNDDVYTVASDACLIGLIQQARRQIIVVSPGLTEKVAECLRRRAATRTVSITIVVDGDPEVYRLGYGDQAALTTLKSMAFDSAVNLRLQEGIRIGLVVSDDETIVFSPTPRMIEAGSTSTEKPNAVILSGAASLDRLAAAGSESSSMVPEIGRRPLTERTIAAMESDLKTNPPQPFNITRAMRIFSAEVQYVEFKVENYQMAHRRVALPSEFTAVKDEKLKKQISSRIQVLDSDLGPFEIPVHTLHGQCLKKVDERWIRAERKRLEDTYTFVIPGHGRVLLKSQREAFEKSICLFRTNLDVYYNRMANALNTMRDTLVRSVVNEYLPIWKGRPPDSFSKYGLENTEENIRTDLEWKTRDIIEQAVTIERPTVTTVYKEISPESVRDRKRFIDPLRKAMQSRDVPQGIIDNIFKMFDAAPSAGSEN